MLRGDKEEVVFAVFSPIEILTCCRVEVVIEKNSMKQKLKSAIRAVGRAVKKRSKQLPSRLNKKVKPGTVSVTKKGAVDYATGIPKSSKSDLKIS